MPTVCVVEELDQEPAAVWQRVTDVAGYPEFMDSVRTIEILTGSFPVSAPQALGGAVEVVGWEIELEGAIMRWVQLERRDADRLVVDFHQLRGDLDVFEGSWQLRPRADGGTTVELVVRFEVGLELLRDVLDPYAAESIERNSRSMLRSLRDR